MKTLEEDIYTIELTEEHIRYLMAIGGYIKGFIGEKSIRYQLIAAKYIREVRYNPVCTQDFLTQKGEEAIKKYNDLKENNVVDLDTLRREKGIL